MFDKRSNITGILAIDEKKQKEISETIWTEVE